MPERKADFVASDLLSRIVGGDLPCGTLLPKEPELAARYDVNKSVVREAVKQLEVHRLVRPVRRRGTVVLDPAASLSAEVLRAMLAPAGQGVDRAMLANLCEIRAVIDVEMHARAAERRTEADLEALEACHRSLRAALAKPREYGRRVDDFVLAVARATGNRIFEMFVHWHRQVYRDLEDLFLTVRLPVEPHLQGVRLVLDAIRARDADLARSLAQTYHEWATPRLLEALG